MRIETHENYKADGVLPFDDLSEEPYYDPYEEPEIQYDGVEQDGDDVEARRSTDIDVIRREHRLVLQKVDFLLPQLVAMVKDRKVLDLTPKYQRRFRWKRIKQSQLIESLLLNIPMPSIFLYEIDLAEYEVMDGRQRLSTVHDFFSDKGFKLQGLKELSFLNGLTYRELPSKIQATLRRASFPVTIILSETEETNKVIPRLRQLVFERLNTGGQILNLQEVRNCIYDGAFNDMLVRVARSDLFTTVWGIPPKEPNEQTEPSEKLKRNRYFATMADCEIVLRYFAFADKDSYTVPQKALDACMKANYKCSETEASEFEHDYMRSLQLATDIYGKKTFRVFPHLVSSGTKRDNGKLSAPLSDAILLACKEHYSSRDTLIANRLKIVKDTEDLMKSKDSYDALIGSKNTRVEFKRRLELLSDIFAKHK